jgi:hypothetical protein
LRRTPAAGDAARAARGSLRDALSGMGLIRISGILLALIGASVGASTAAGFELTSLRLAVEEATATRLPVDGRSDLTGGAAHLTYTPGLGLRELVTDEPAVAGPDDGARWELRSRFTEGYNALTLAHYIFEPRLDDDAAVEEFVAHYTAWFPHPVHSVRVECIARSQARRFKRLCAEAMRSLEFSREP